MTYWKLKGSQLVNCSCDYGCNCQFGGLPDKGHCYAVFGMEVDAGHHGDVDLSGLKIGAVFKWPGPIHDGHGECVAFVDENADEAQRSALLAIMTGADTDPMATMFAVFASTVETMHEPLFVPIEFAVDVEGRKGKMIIPGHVEMEGEPIKSPVDGREIRARIHLPDGFEYEYADIGSASSKSTTPVPVELSSTYGQFAHLNLDRHGVVHA